MSYLKSLRSRATLIDVFKQHPDLTRRLHSFADQLMRGPSPLTPAWREYLAWYVSLLNKCSYCTASHGLTAELLGTPPEWMEPTQDEPPAAVDKRLRAALQFVSKLTLRPQDVEESDVAALAEQGWSDEAIAHIVFVCGYFSMMNRIVEGLGIDPDPRAAKMAAKVLSEKGYQGASKAAGLNIGKTGGTGR